MKRTWAVGLDMGGTNIRCAAVSLDGDVLLLHRGPSHASRGAAAIAVNIGDQLIALIDEARARGLGSPKAIGVAVPDRWTYIADCARRSARRRMARLPL